MAFRLESSAFGVLEGEEEKREMCRWRTGKHPKSIEKRAAERVEVVFSGKGSQEMKKVTRTFCQGSSQIRLHQRVPDGIPPEEATCRSSGSHRTND